MILKQPFVPSFDSGKSASRDGCQCKNVQYLSNILVFYDESFVYN